MNTKHTSEKWEIGAYSPNQDEYREVRTDKKIIARVFNENWGSVTKKEAESNARLIVQSPNLLQNARDNHDVMLALQRTISEPDFDKNYAQKLLQEARNKTMEIIRKAEE